MSSSAPGKYQDHYIALGVEPKADSDAIQAAYAKLARKYHPDNAETGDEKMFEAINLAYEVLSDPVLRVGFDKLKGIDRDAGAPTFSGAVFFEALKRGATLRSAVLCILCDRRRIKPFTPTMSLRDLESMLQSTNEELSFAMWYLKQRNFVVNDDKSNLQITVEGMDHLEQNPPAPETILPLIKPESIMGVSVPAQPSPSPAPQPAQPAQKEPPAQPVAKPAHLAEPVLKALHRALTREPRDVLAVAPRQKS